MVKRTIGGIERDDLLLAVQRRRQAVRADRPDRRRSANTSAARHPRLHRLGGTDFAKAKSRVRSAVREIAQELVVLYQKRVNADRPHLRHRHPVAGRDGGRLPVRRDAGPTQAIDDVKRGHGTAAPDGSPRCAATSVSARPRWRSAPRSKRSKTASRSPCSRRRRCSSTQHDNTFADRFAGYPIRVEMLSRFLTTRQAKPGHRRPGQR